MKHLREYALEYILESKEDADLIKERLDNGEVFEELAIQTYSFSS